MQRTCLRSLLHYLLQPSPQPTAATTTPTSPPARASVIIAQHNYSPKRQFPSTAGQQKEIPQLYRWSDVVWLAWTMVAGGDRDKGPAAVHRPREHRHDGDRGGGWSTSSARGAGTRISCRGPGQLAVRFDDGGREGRCWGRRMGLGWRIWWRIIVSGRSLLDSFRPTRPPKNYHYLAEPGGRECSGFLGHLGGQGNADSNRLAMIGDALGTKKKVPRRLHLHGSHSAGRQAGAAERLLHDLGAAGCEGVRSGGSRSAEDVQGYDLISSSAMNQLKREL